jgi:hypothetical protein
MRKDYTLPELQEQLNGLKEGELFGVSDADCERLFGLNDVAMGRIANFAKGHRCVVGHSERGIYFRKMLEDLKISGSRPAQVQER